MVELLYGAVGSGWHSCIHNRMRVEKASAPISWTYENTPTQWYDFTVMSWGFWTNGYQPDAMGAATTYLSSGRLSELEDRALSAMLPTMRADVSLVNSLIELKDFVTLKSSVESTLNAMKWFKEMFQKHPEYLRHTLRQLKHSAADWFLQWNFNFSPLVKDVDSIYHSLASSREYAKRILRDEGKLRRQHYTVDILDEFPGVDVTSTGSNLGGEVSVDGGLSWSPWDANLALSSTTVSHRVIERYTMARFNATIEYRYDLTQFERDNAVMLSFLDRLGVRLDPSIIWNAIPWSFVVDWVLGISKYLKARAVRNIDPHTVISNYCYSVKLEKFGERSIELSGSTHSSGTAPVTCIRWKDEAYERVVCTPSLTNALSTSDLNAKEYSLAAALIAAR